MTVWKVASLFLVPYGFVAATMIVQLIRHRSPMELWMKLPKWAMVATVIGGIGGLVVNLALLLFGVHNDQIQWIVGVGALAFVGYAIGGGLARQAPPAASYRRGAVVSTAKDIAELYRSRRADADKQRKTDRTVPVMLAGIPVAVADETKHFKFIGTTGTGKSTAIREMLSAALARGDRAIIADPDGGYLNHFYDPGRGDVILNPFDPDSVKWNLLGEITNDHDVDQLARSLIPDSSGSDLIWSGYARTFFTALTQQVIAARIENDYEIYRLIAKAPVAELKLLLAGTAAGPFLEDGNEKMFGSVRSVTSSAVSALPHTTQQLP